MAKQIIEDVQTRMNKSLEAIKHELATVRTGKALPSILDQVRVDAYGS
ncbi:MAG: ribosome recycling factor, partial [candidate division Zixibacteria bacterium]|nr:ribosome recycling factor [candidate division Zixibacteria bacterium]